jgi:integrase
MEKLLTVAEVAERLNCHPQTVYRNRDLPCINIPGVGKRYRESELDKYIKQKSTFLHKNVSDHLPFAHGKPTLDLGGVTCEMPKGKNKTRYNFGFGAIYQRKTKQGKIRWYLDYRDGNGNRIQKVAPLATTKEEATVALKEEIHKTFDTNHGVEREKRKVKFKEFSDMFIENYSKVNKESWKDDQERLQWVKGLFGEVALNEISPMHIERLKSRKLEEGVTRTTVNHYLKTLRRMFNIAINWGYADKNPVRGIRFYSEKDAQRDRVLTEGEEDRLLGAASGSLRSILIVALNTGMRKGEILQLKWQDIDLENRIILVKKTKSGKPRTLPINSRLLDELIRLKNRSRNSQYLFTNSSTGRQLKTIRKSFDAALQAANIQGLRFHDLRRTFGSRLALAGVDLNRIKELLGHASIKTTEIYLHAELKDIREAVEVLCQNPPKSAKKRGDLLHIRYTKKDDQESHPVSSLFSVN